MRGPGRLPRGELLISDAEWEAICCRLEDGEQLFQILPTVGLTTTQWYDQMRGNRQAPRKAARLERYRRAREVQAERMLDRMFAEVEAAKLATSSEQVQAHRLAVDTLKWAAAKLYPRMFGERQVVEHENAAPLVLNILKA